MVGEVAWARAVANEAVGVAVGRLTRGWAWQGLAREIAFRVVVASGCGFAATDGLACVAEKLLCEEIGRAVEVVAQVALQSRADHLCLRPHDAAGAELVGALDAGEEAVRVTAKGYLSVLDILLERGPNAAVAVQHRPRRLARLLRIVPAGELADPLAAELVRPREHIGWPRHHAA